MRLLFSFIITVLMLSGCATWKGAKKDSSDAWKATKKTSKKVWEKTKETSVEVYEDTKKAINKATSD